MGIVVALFSTAALADDVLIVGDYSNAKTNIIAELEAVGHTVTEVSSLPADISNIEQIWDLRINDAISTADQAAYDTFLQNSGYLYLAGENSNFATRNNSISEFTSTLGGGAVSVGGSPSNAQDGNDSYFSSDTSVDFIAAATITNTDGTGRVLAADANGNPTGMIWIGNAGDFSSKYNGTVVVIADINWTQSNYYDANNEQFLEELIAGVVAGTVEGTIDESGTGTDVGGAPAEPAAPTLVSSEAGDPIVVVTSADGGTVTTIVSNNAVSETDTQQTVETTTTTSVTTATNTTTCTTPTTVETYSDSSTETVQGTESCATATTYASTSSDAVESVSGRIDQTATAADVVDVNLRNLSFDGIQGIRSNHDYANGMSGSTTGFTLGGEVIADNGLMFGGGWARINTDLSGNGDTATANTNAFEGNVGRAMAAGVGTVTLRHATTDYGFGRTIGDWSNTGATSGTNSSISGRYTIATDPKFNPYVGYTIGRRSMDAYTEGGDALTARSVTGTDETYRYATVGANLQLGLINLHGEYNTDDVQAMGVGIGKTTEKLEWNLGVEKTTTDLGENTGITAGIKIRF